jgi:hypothetical protein
LSFGTAGRSEKLLVSLVPSPSETLFAIAPHFREVRPSQLDDEECAADCREDLAERGARLDASTKRIGCADRRGSDTRLVAREARFQATE